MVKYIKNRILLAQSPANVSLGFQAVSSSSLGVTFAGYPDTSSDARLLRGLAIHFPTLLYSWDNQYSKFFIKCNKEMGVLMVVSPQVSPGRQTRVQHSTDPFSAISRILLQVQNMVRSIFQRERRNDIILFSLKLLTLQMTIKIQQLKMRILKAFQHCINS